MTYTDLPAWSVPLWFFFWAPVAVFLVFFLIGRLSRRAGVPRALEGDWDGYDLSDVRRLFEIYGERGRAAYRGVLLPADAGFAALYGIVGLVLTLGLTARDLPLWAALACGLPWFLGALADIAEGMALARLLDFYPRLAEGQVALASRLTRIKLALFSLGTIGAIAAFVLAARPTLLTGG